VMMDLSDGIDWSDWYVALNCFHSDSCYIFGLKLFKFRIYVINSSCAHMKTNYFLYEHDYYFVGVSSLATIKPQHCYYLLQSAQSK
jgi:hypothetical protein